MSLRSSLAWFSDAITPVSSRRRCEWKLRPPTLARIRASWAAVETNELDPEIQLVPKRHAAVTNKSELPALKITEPEPGRIVFDLGQNIVGIPKLEIPVKKNQKVTIVTNIRVLGVQWKLNTNANNA